MIETNKAKSYRCCNCCGSNKNVIEIYFRMDCQGTGVALCEDCTKELFAILKPIIRRLNLKGRD